LCAPKYAREVHIGRMDTLGVTLDALFAAIDRLIARKEGLFAGKEEAFAAKNKPIDRMVGHIAVKSGGCERSRGGFAVMTVEYAVMKGHNAAKRVSFAAMGVH
jgi:hypothetical protein